MQSNSPTHGSLREAFADEARTAQRYLYFAELAEIEGHGEAAVLFRELAESATHNAHGHLDWLRRIGDPLTDLPMGDTEQNLRCAVAREAMESTTTYPRWARQALEEGFTDVASWLDCLATYKRAHLERFRAALQAPRDGSLG